MKDFLHSTLRCTSGANIPRSHNWKPCYNHLVVPDISAGLKVCLTIKYQKMTICEIPQHFFR